MPLLALMLTLAACSSNRAGVAFVVPQNTGQSALAFQLARGTSEFGPILQVTIQNQTTSALCLRADALRNSRTQEMLIYLREAGSRELQWQNPGLIPPPLEGAIRIEPGASAQGRYSLRGRFPGSDAWESLPQGWQARVAVSYGRCDDATAQWAASDWQPI